LPTLTPRGGARQRHRMCVADARDMQCAPKATADLMVPWKAGPASVTRGQRISHCAGQLIARPPHHHHRSCVDADIVILPNRGPSNSEVISPKRRSTQRFGSALPSRLHEPLASLNRPLTSNTRQMGYRVAPPRWPLAGPRRPVHRILDVCRALTAPQPARIDGAVVKMYLRMRRESSIWR